MPGPYPTHFFILMQFEVPFRLLQSCLLHNAAPGVTIITIRDQRIGSISMKQDENKLEN